MRRLTGFGFSQSADGYVYQVHSVEKVAEVLALAKAAGRKVVLRGNGRSYGDAALSAENIVLDITKMNEILSWDPVSGIIEAEAGATIEHLWRRALPDGWWPPVVSGTMFPTLAGALAMNIHGKNAFREGTLGEHVLEIDVVTPQGELKTLAPPDPLFHQVISSAGLLAAIVRVKLQMKHVESGELRVLPVSQANWDSQFAAFEKYAPDADYLVSWVDCFATGAAAGRGLIHAAWYAKSGAPSLKHESQDLPSKFFAVIPKSVLWRFLKPLTNRTGMKLLNSAKHASAELFGNAKEHGQSLVAFSFLLDYVPDWRKAYLPGGFIQYQSFVPKEHAPRVFATQVQWQQEAGLEAFLGVMKRHRPDGFMFTHAVDGFSLALDFKVTEANREKLWALCHRMNDLVLEAGGRFYFAKDSTLRAQDVERYLGAETLAAYRKAKSLLDPDGLLTSSLAERVGL
jgi:decaprenylphospho-beta-D-ribofuranose 2-oxidase